MSLDHVGVGEDKGEDLFANGGKAGAAFDAVLFDLMEEGIFLLAVHTGCVGFSGETAGLGTAKILAACSGTTKHAQAESSAKHS